MRVILTVLLLLTVTPMVRAVTVRGIVCSSEDERIIIGAEVLALVDSVQTFTARSDNRGSFSLKLPDGTVSCRITVSNPGYEAQTISVANPEGNIKLGRILLLPAPAELDEVTVTASGSRVIDLPDKSIIFTTQRERDRATDPMNLLAQLSYVTPMLTVSGSGDAVSIMGASPQVLINGVSRTYTDLNALDPQDIIKVEYVTHPDIRYGAPYINIVTVRHPTGGSVMAAFSAPVTRLGISPQAYASYRRGIHEVSLNCSGSLSKRRGEHYDLTEQYTAPDGIWESRLVGLPGHSSERGWNVSADYYLMGGPGRMLVTTLSLGRSSSQNHRSQESGDPDSPLTRTTDSHNRSLTPSLNLYGTLTLPGGGRIETSLYGSFGRGSIRESMSQSDGYDYTMLLDFGSGSHSLGAMLYYEQGLPWAKLSASLTYKSSRIPSRCDIDGEVQHAAPRQSCTFLSATLSGQLVGVQYYVSAGFSHTAATERITSPYAYLYLRRRMGPVSLVCEGRTATTAPWLSSYSDLTIPVNPLLFTRGNPHLRDVISRYARVYAGYSHGALFTSLSVSYTYQHNLPVSVCRYVDDPVDPLYRKFLMIIENGRGNSTFSSDLGMGVNNVLGMFSVRVDGSLRHMRSRGPVAFPKRTCLDASASASAYLGNWQLRLWANPFPSYTLWGNTVRMQRQSPLWGMSASWHRGPWSLSCSVNDLFIRRPAYQEATVLAGDLVTESRLWTVDDANLVKVTVRYQISFGRQARKAERTLGGASGIDFGR